MSYNLPAFGLNKAGCAAWLKHAATSFAPRLFKLTAAGDHLRCIFLFKFPLSFLGQNFAYHRHCAISGPG
jgi:hypothetical protein